MIPRLPGYDLDFATSGKAYQFRCNVKATTIPGCSLAGRPCMQMLSPPHLGISGLGSLVEIRQA